MSNSASRLRPLCESARRRSMASVWTVLFFVCAWSGFGGIASGQLSALRIQDYATAPMTGSTVFPSATANSAYLARVNFMAEEPGGANRFFVNDLNGPLYTLDKTTKQFNTYLNFNGRSTNTGLFDKFVFGSGFANGLITFQFDPDYNNNGKFYTVHMEEPGAAGSLLPDNSSFPGFDTTGYATTPTVDAPGGTARQTVLIQWRDTNLANNTFEGTARELLRLDMVGQIHPLGDLIFNPLAGPADPDWRVMYLSVGDGGAGEQSTTGTRMTPQRLDTLNGKVLRIIPDTDQHTATSTLSPNGQYRIPNDNPFTSINNAAVRDELFAVGLRNPHRMTWDVDPTNPTNNRLIVSDIGLHTWEEVNIIHAGNNYGYSQREGNEVLISNSVTGPLPINDTIPVQITDTVTAGTVVPTYPVVQYGHSFSDSQFIGDSISSGYVYRGTRIPELYGKFVFGEITTGQIFYADYDEMLSADDGDPSTLAEIHSLNILWDDPNDAQGELEFTTNPSTGPVHGPMFQIARRTYVARGGQDPDLPGNADVTGGSLGRADIRIQVDEDGELYILSKSDGMIRAIVGTPTPLFTLTVDPATGYARLANTSTVDLSIDGYSVLSQSGALEPADGNWLSFADRGISGWVESAPTATELSELIPQGEMLLASGAAFDMGRLFDPTGQHDLQLEFIIADEELPRPGVVLYQSLGLPGDYNQNGSVDAADYVVWRKTFGQSVPAFSGADGDGNGQITNDDYNYWRARFGNTLAGAGAAQSASVPEPGAAMLALLAVAMGCLITTCHRSNRRSAFYYCVANRPKS